RELGQGAAPLAIDSYEDVGCPFQRRELSSHKLSGARSAPGNDGCFSIDTHSRLVELHRVMCERTRFHYRKKSVLLNDSAVSVHNDPILSDKSFNGFGVVRHNRVLEIFLDSQQLLNRFVIHASAVDLSVSNGDTHRPYSRRSSNFQLN